MRKIFTLMLLSAALFVSCKKSKTPDPEPTPPAEIVLGGAVSVAANATGITTIDANTLQQNISGFGGASILQWRGDLTIAQRQKLFSPTDGLGLSVVRVRIPNSATDFAAEKPTIDAAKSFGAKVIATAWSAPASMKTNNNIIGGKLKTTSYAEYAAFLKSYVTAVGGVTAISPTNEPNITVDYESMLMTAEEVADFVAAQGDNLGAPVMAPEPFNMSQAYLNTYLANPAAAAKTTYLAGHIYGAAPTTFTPGKEIWMTEHYTNTEDGNGWIGALGVAKELHDCMNAGYSMYVWWYMSRYYGLISETADVPTKRGYAMAQFSKWVRPGYRKVSATANPQTNVFVTAYKSGSKLVLVIINQNNTIVAQPFGITGIITTGFNRYYTDASSNLKDSNFTIPGYNFSINLAPLSVTTLVSM
jgi:glucuronoarabinoxylan endo-1,4-beta-xylanase